MFKTGIGQDSHAFEEEGSPKTLMLGGVAIPGCVGLKGNSDADVVLHALTNAVSSISGINILGARSDHLCLSEGIADSRAYLAEALATLEDYQLTHVSVTIEAQRPTLAVHIPAMKASIALLCGLKVRDVGVTATSGERLTSFGCAKGIQAFAVASAVRADILHRLPEGAQA